ncbi:hypothetical protein SNARM312S_02079 [Streptomyces narbonensis]
MTDAVSARERILARVRAAVAGAPEAPAVDRDYRTSHTADDPAAVLGLLHENLADYRAHVHRTAPGGLAALVAERLAERGARSVAVPPGLPDAWLAATDAVRRPDEPRLTPYEHDGIDAVVTGCALAIAETRQPGVLEEPLLRLGQEEGDRVGLAGDQRAGVPVDDGCRPAVRRVDRYRRRADVVAAVEDTRDGAARDPGRAGR